MDAVWHMWQVDCVSLRWTWQEQEEEMREHDDIEQPAHGPWTCIASEWMWASDKQGKDRLPIAERHLPRCWRTWCLSMASVKCYCRMFISIKHFCNFPMPNQPWVFDSEISKDKSIDLHLRMHYTVPHSKPTWSTKHYDGLGVHTKRALLQHDVCAHQVNC